MRLRAWSKAAAGISLALMLALAACGSTAAPTKVSGKTATTSSAKASASGSPSGSRYGGTLTIEEPNNPPGLDPATVENNDSGYVLATLFDGLVQFKQGTTVVQPALATSWQITNGGKTYTFTLRQGVKFSDGTAFNAQAAAAWVDRETNKKNPNYYGNLKAAGTFMPFIWHAFKDYKVLGPYKLQIDLTQPDGAFLQALAIPYAGVTSPTAIKKYGKDFYKHPVGTGPFVLDKWVKDQYLQLTANKNYWGGKPYLDKIVFQIIPNASTQLLALKTGKINILTDVHPSEVPTIKSDSKLKLIDEPGLTVNGVSMPTQVGPFQKVQVRQALNYAVNKKSLDANLYKGLAKAMTAPAPAVAAYYHANGLPPYTYDLAKAQSLLKQAGYAKGFTATLVSYNGPRGYNTIGGAALSTAIQADLAKVGVTIKVDQVDAATWLGEARSKSFQKMALTGWTGDNGDPDDLIEPLFAAKEIGSGNFAHFDNAQVNKLLVQGVNASAKAQRQKIYDQAQQIIWQQAPWIFLNSADLLRATTSNVHGFVPNPTFMYFHMEKVWLSK